MGGKHLLFCQARVAGAAGSDPSRGHIWMGDEGRKVLSLSWVSPLRVRGGEVEAEESRGEPPGMGQALFCALGGGCGVHLGACRLCLLP